jgi:type VI protein secretion system component VasF
VPWRASPAESLVIRHNVNEHRGQHQTDHKPKAPIMMQFPARWLLVMAVLVFMLVFMFYAHSPTPLFSDMI